MLEYSPRALATRPIFYDSYNDITIIVEDFDDENFYTHLFQRLLGNSLRIGKVLGVGGKSQVIERFNARASERKTETREFYLVDGDFDELLGLSAPKDVCFYRLPRYDIESFLVEESAVCQIAQEQRPKRNAEWYRSAMGFNDWKNQMAELAMRYVACFALCQQCDIEDHKGSQNIERFTPGNEHLPDSTKIETFINEVKTGQSAMESSAFDSRIEEMIQTMGNSDEERFRWISGKLIVLPLLGRLLKTYTRRNIAQDSLRFRLIGYCELESLGVLKKVILDLYASPASQDA